MADIRSIDDAVELLKAEIAAGSRAIKIDKVETHDCGMDHGLHIYDAYFYLKNGREKELYGTLIVAFSPKDGILDSAAYRGSHPYRLGTVALILNHLEPDRRLKHSQEPVTPSYGRHDSNQCTFLDFPVQDHGKIPSAAGKAYMVHMFRQEQKTVL